MQVSQEIEDAILSKKLTLGERLPSEFELCSQFGVSRTAIREALKNLSAKGLISIEKGKGIFVRNLSPDHVMNSLHNYLELKSSTNNMIEVMEARIIIEPAIAEFAALHHNYNDIELLYQNIELMKINTEENEHARLDMKFHLYIAEASRNHIMPLILNPIHRMMPKIKKKIMELVPGAKDSAIVYHKQIADAIAAGDSKKAYTSMKEHLLIAKEHTEQMIRNSEIQEHNL